MGDIDEEDLVSNGARLGMFCHGLAYDFVPRSYDGIGLQRDIDVQSLQGALKNGMDGLGLLHSYILKHQIPSTNYQINSNF
jgi:hypothetical protein